MRLKFINKALPALALLLFFSPYSVAQHVRLSPFIGYATDARLETNAGYLRIGNGATAGVALDLSLGPSTYGQFSLSRRGSNLDLEGGISSQRISRLAVSCFSAGVLRELKPVAGFKPYGILGAGLLRFNPVKSDLKGTTRMQVSPGAGVLVPTGEKTGIRFQARFIIPFLPGTNYFSNSSGKNGYTISGGVKAVHAELSAAFLIDLR